MLPKSMLCTVKRIRVLCSLLLSLSLALAVFVGCQPLEEPPALSGDTANVAEDAAAGNLAAAIPAASKSSSNVIDGELDSVDWRSLVGKDVTIKGKLVVVDTYDLARRGQVKLARERMYIPTSRIDPNDKNPDATSYEGGSNTAEVAKAQKFNDSATVLIDDNESDQNIFPPPLFPELGTTHPTVRVGSTVDGVSGRIIESNNRFTLVTKKPLKWTPAERPKRPEVGASDVTVASFNVLNYFTTLDERGADTDSELSRQEAKLVAAITELDADVVGLMEIENNVEAEKRLVTALNAKIGKAVFQGSGVPAGFDNSPGGGDAIRVGIIYRADRVEPKSDVTMVPDEAFEIARTPIVQSFASKGGGKPFTVIVNHFKSKGGSDRADPENKNKGDGQSAFNAARRAQAFALAEYVDSLTATTPDPRVLIIGDLNAYQQEDPIDALRAKGFVDLHEGAPNSSEGKPHYSFVYYGQSGSLDHALATKSLAADVTGVATWHINSDEPRFLDYNEEYNPAALFKADPFRSSDHDPVLIGIRN